MLYTASRNTPKDHRGVLLDVTVKSARPTERVFAPTWELVHGSKSGRLTWEQYTEGYLALLRERWLHDAEARARITRLALQAVEQDVTVLCYCASPLRCHRSLLAALLVKVAAKEGKALTTVVR